MSDEIFPAWVYDAAWDTLDLRFVIDGKVIHAFITARPIYCDRGHWMFNVDGPLNLDGADSFPRYYMSLERALEEAEAFLRWRLLKRTATPNFPPLLSAVGHGRRFHLEPQP